MPKFNVDLNLKLYTADYTAPGERYKTNGWMCDKNGMDTQRFIRVAAEQEMEPKVLTGIRGVGESVNYHIERRPMPPAIWEWVDFGGCLEQLWGQLGGYLLGMLLREEPELLTGAKFDRSRHPKFDEESGGYRFCLASPDISTVPMHFTNNDSKYYVNTDPGNNDGVRGCYYRWTDRDREYFDHVFAMLDRMFYLSDYGPVNRQGPGRRGAPKSRQKRKTA